MAQHRATIFACLDQHDPTIQMTALQLVTGLVTRRSLLETVVKLMERMRTAEPQFCDELVWTVLTVCSKNRYELVTDFAWCVRGNTSSTRPFTP